MFQFFVNNKHENFFILDKKTLNHIKVARIEKNNFICVFKETFYKCYLQNNKAIIIEKLNLPKDSLKEIILAISYFDNKRFEWMIQKTTELGVTKIVPMLSQNVSQKITFDFTKKLKRWASISLHASQQSMRSTIPQITNLTKFEDVLNNFNKVKNKYIAYTKNNNNFVSSFSDHTIFLIGPEGGFTTEEIELAKFNKFQVISLGKRILRSETAPLFLLSRINE